MSSKEVILFVSGSIALCSLIVLILALVKRAKANKENGVNSPQYKNFNTIVTLSSVMLVLSLAIIFSISGAVGYVLEMF